MNIHAVKMGDTPLPVLLGVLDQGMSTEFANDFCALFSRTLREIHPGPVEVAVRLEKGKLTICGEAPSKLALHTLIALAEEALAKDLEGTVKKDTMGLLHLTVSNAVAISTDIKKFDVRIVHQESKKNE